MSAILEKTYTRSVMNGSGVYTKLNVFHLHDGTYDVILLRSRMIVPLGCRYTRDFFEKKYKKLNLKNPMVIFGKKISSLKCLSCDFQKR